MDDVYAILSDKTRNDVLDWLVTTGPSPNHNNACQLHDPETGTWLTDSEEYRDWKNYKTRFLWLNSIPGAGKTVLFSYICGDIKLLCKPPATQFTAACWASTTAISDEPKMKHHISYVGP